MVVFLSPSTASKADDPKLADKESILASLNLKAMSFDDAVGLLSENTRNAFAGLEFSELPQVERRGSAFGCNIPIITEVGELSAQHCAYHTLKLQKLRLLKVTSR